jgi:hypothetical protein
MSKVKRIQYLIAFLLFLNLCVLGVFGMVWLQNLSCKKFSKQARLKSSIQKMDLIMTGLFLFKKENNRFPSEKEGIHILSQHIMSGPYLKGSYECDGWGTMIRYKINLKKPYFPILWSAGKDKKWNTLDDLRKNGVDSILFKKGVTYL